jgi:6-phosphogluconolactonase/glucosamine-6-phosphate isomerase/deaminase
MGEIGGRFEILPDPVALARRVAEWMTLAALAAKGTFRVSPSGGSTPTTLCSRRVAFLMTGREKAAILRAIRAGNSDAHASSACRGKPHSHSTR